MVVHKKELRKKIEKQLAAEEELRDERTNNAPPRDVREFAPAARACVLVGWWSSSPAIIECLSMRVGYISRTCSAIIGCTRWTCGCIGCGVVSTNEMSSRVVVGLCVKGVPDNGYRSIGCSRFRPLHTGLAFKHNPLSY